MFTDSELDTLRSCWVLPDGKLWSVPSESHDWNLPDGLYKESFDGNGSVLEVESKCFRMSFSWGWTAPISQMTIAATCDLTEPQKQIIRYLLMAKIITYKQIQYHGHREEIYAMLDEIETQIKNDK